MYVQHMVQATEGVHPDLLQYIFASWTAMKTLKGCVCIGLPLARAQSTKTHGISG